MTDSHYDEIVQQASAPLVGWVTTPYYDHLDLEPVDLAAIDIIIIKLRNAIDAYRDTPRKLTAHEDTAYNTLINTWSVLSRIKADHDGS